MKYKMSDRLQITVETRFYTTTKFRGGGPTVQPKLSMVLAGRCFKIIILVWVSHVYISILQFQSWIVLFPTIYV